ncbi:MAG: NUDIX domain-containing protein [Chitinophagales bacterium]|nr:NUDIX domain-containing protein [Chitinophagales bacterium]
MKKIFINNSSIFLASYRERNTSLLKYLEEEFFIYEFQNKKDLLKQIETIEQQPPATWVILHKSISDLERVFLSCYKKITAAGGVVFNEEDKILMIFRRGKWDLPKGKLEKGESIRETAKREVQEETAIENLTLQSQIKFLKATQGCTYHTYNLKGKRILKSTYWYRMKSKDRKLIPQANEGIEKAEWCTRSKVKQNLKNSYLSIVDVLNEI